MISARNLTLRVGERTLLERVSFDVDAGEFVAVLGPNGVGKTTLLRTLAGARAADDGTVQVRGRTFAEIGHTKRAREISYMTSEDLFAEYLTVRDVVANGRYAYHRWWQWHAAPGDDDAIDEALRAVQMQEFAARSFASLSSGERQRVWLALGLAQGAPLLLLDEPTSHLDVHAAQSILALLRRQVAAGKGVICALHDLNEAAQYADRVMLLGERTVIAFDAPERALHPETLERVYGIAMEHLRSASGALRVFPVTTDRRSR